ncbi:YycH family regulatory protein [Paenibacillus methanolicus]|uniref:Regulatory protein YycH of two-component signal transduction system YycFG n=1 Tax=Paenibacillus methanolicus TaxID=582686 RepID=A0A5S5C862_9BACL|nr:two-component system activity regulator YycH [Paenibacillus methanolicus]TYP75369.1 regulatory protein YycH of two-component signal transduction system YycFG [Paenibacillus methanolicus]
MMEKIKTVLLVFLVALSLLQSYWLAYSMPGIGVTVSQKQDYVKADLKSDEEKLENLIFPEDMVLHFGSNQHTLLYPETNFYDLIFDRVRGREFKDFQRDARYAVDWDEVRAQSIGVELRFGTGVPVELLSKVLKLSEGDSIFQNDSISNIWIFKSPAREEVSTYFFSTDGTTVYESVRADLTVRDVQNYVGFGQYWTPYQYVAPNLYLAKEPLQAVEAVVGFSTYTPEQMQHNLFSDPSATRAINDENDVQTYTDHKRGLQVEQGGRWIRYTDPAPAQDSVAERVSENVYASIQFINEHGGWDGRHRFIEPGMAGGEQMIRYQQYYGAFPVLSKKPFLYGEMLLRMQQGVVTEYERSIATMADTEDRKEVRWLPGGSLLSQTLAGYSRRGEVEAIFPAVEVELVEGRTEADADKLRVTPIWAVRLRDGSQEKLLSAVAGSRKPAAGEPGGADKDNPGALPGGLSLGGTAGSLGAVGVQLSTGASLPDMRR